MRLTMKMKKVAKNESSGRCRAPADIIQADRKRPGAPSCPTKLLAIPLLLATVILLSSVSCVVVYQVRFIATKNGRTDYALAGESIELSCHYIMKDEAEDIKQLVWSKDGKNFLRWRKNKPGLEVLSYTFKGHIDPTSKHSHITIHNTTIDMHGKYKCSIKTDLGTHDMEQDLIVISQSQCKLNDWRITSQPSECRELFKFDCKNMFPKPVPSCGLWNGKLEKFIRSVTIDISEEPQKQTYRVRYSDKFELPNTNRAGQINGSSSTNQHQQQPQKLDSDLLQFAGHLMFKCDISVPETSWKLSIIHKMFDFNDGCNQDPLETIERMRLNYSHYATSLIQQAGYLSADRQLDEFEMLPTSNLKYELLHPAALMLASSGSGGGKKMPLFHAATTTSKHPTTMTTISPLELNCWQKPRLGSLARLTCASKSPDQTRLVGANLLECQPTGWAPISAPSAANGATADSLSKQQQKKLLSRHRRPPGQTAGLTWRPSRRVGLPGDPDGAGSIPPGGSNDLDKMDDSVAASTESTTTTNSNSNVTVLATEDGETIPTATPTEILNLEDNGGQPDANANGPTKLTPAQLAPLLPTCVSTRRHLTNIIGNNRLPLRDEVRILESSLTSGQQANKSGKQGGNNNNQEHESKQKPIFNFSSSGGSNSRTNLLTSLLVSIVVALTSLYTIQQQQQQQ